MGISWQSLANMVSTCNMMGICYIFTVIGKVPLLLSDEPTEGDLKEMVTDKIVEVYY